MIKRDNPYVTANGKKITQAFYKAKKYIISTACGLLIVTSLSGCGASSLNLSRDEIQTKIESNNKHFHSYYNNISDQDLVYLPASLEDFNIYNCQYISDLSMLPVYCPNLKSICINSCASITDLSFLKNFNNLKKVEIYESTFVTQDLVDYFNTHGIQHNITQKDLENARFVDSIISEIITDGMTDEEKIQAITYYVCTNYEYNLKATDKSNDYPLSSFIEDKSGVCASYAYLTNVLLRKADITSYEIANDNHAWNVLTIDGKYYYIDTTNINQVPGLSSWLLENYNIGLFYMVDPKTDFMSAMTKYDRKVVIPDQLIEDIKKGEDQKTLREKYKNRIPEKALEVLIILVALGLGLSLASKVSLNTKHRKRY